MTQIDRETKKRNVLRTYDILHKTYTQQLEALRKTVIAKESSQTPNLFIVQPAITVLDYLNSYKTIIERIVENARNPKNGNEPEIGTISRNIKSMQKVLPAIQHSNALLNAQDETDIQNKSAELLGYVQEELTSNPTWNHRLSGAMQVVFGILVAAAGLAMAGWYFGMMLSPAAPLVIAIIFAFYGSMFGAIGSLAGMAFIRSGIGTFIDSDPNRDSLHDKLLDFNGAFFTPEGVSHNHYSEQFSITGMQTGGGNI